MYPEKSPTPPLPNFTFASVALFLNQEMRKHEDDFSGIIIMDDIVKKKSTLNCSLARIITEDAESPSWDMFFCGSEDGGRNSLSIKPDRASFLFKNDFAFPSVLLHFNETSYCKLPCSTSAQCKDTQSLPAFYTIYFFI